MSFTVKGTEADKEFQLTIGEAKDAEGTVIPASAFEHTAPVSDNESAINFPSFDRNTGKGVISFGTAQPNGEPNVANVRSDIVDKRSGKVVGVTTGTVIIVPGDAATVTGGFAIDGLTEDAPTPAPEPEPSGDNGDGSDEPADDADGSDEPAGDIDSGSDTPASDTEPAPTDPTPGDTPTDPDAPVNVPSDTGTDHEAGTTTSETAGSTSPSTIEGGSDERFI